MRLAACALVVLAACSKPPPPLVRLGHATTVGQRYHVHYERQSEGNTRVIDGTATVTAVSERGPKLAFVVDITSSGAPIAKGATFDGHVDYDEAGTTSEAEATGSSKSLAEPLASYDMSIQAILGARCAGPVGEHRVGDAWQMRPEIHWSFVSLDGDIATYQVYDSTPDTGDTEDARVSTTDQMVRTCNEKAPPDPGEEHFANTLAITVTRL